MIIEQNGNREDKPLCNVAMVAKFLDLNTTVFPQIWQEKTKKIDMCDFPLHDCTATQESNKTVTKQDTGTTQQQKNDQTSRSGAHVLTEPWRIQRRGPPPIPLVLDESRGPHG